MKGDNESGIEECWGMDESCGGDVVKLCNAEVFVDRKALATRSEIGDEWLSEGGSRMRR